MEKEMIKEMEKYKILTFADILRALKEHPEWVEELRKIILTEELIELPRKFNELLLRFEKLEKKVDKIEADLEVLKQDLRYLKEGFGRFKCKDFERTIRERYYAYFGRLLRKAKLIQFEEILPKIDEAEEKGIITEEERDSIVKLDLIVTGQIKKTSKDVILAIEVSYSLYEDDIERALKRAGIVASLLEKETIPTIVYVESKEEVEKLAEEKGILLIKTDY
ncbi:MAG: hypothetical protein NZ845_06045 [Thermodesulfovibrio sp.]|nr:hypothetical protein [Thermodesulfovibrio sp.]